MMNTFRHDSSCGFLRSIYFPINLPMNARRATSPAMTKTISPDVAREQITLSTELIGDSASRGPDSSGQGRYRPGGVLCQLSHDPHGETSSAAAQNARSTTRVPIARKRAIEWRGFFKSFKLGSRNICSSLDLRRMPEPEFESGSEAPQASRISKLPHSGSSAHDSQPLICFVGSRDAQEV